MNKKGFTLIELIVVLIIIGILASIAAPMMNGIKAKAIIAEAITGLGALRTALRIYYIEYGAYPPDDYGNGQGWVSDVQDTYGTRESFALFFPGIEPGNWGNAYPAGDGSNGLDGIYFNVFTYGYDRQRYVKCTFGRSTAPKSDEARKLADDYNPGSPASSSGTIFMHLSDGKVTQYYVSKSGYPQEQNP